MGKPERETDVHQIDTVRPAGPEEDVYAAQTVVGAASPKLLEAILKSRSGDVEPIGGLPRLPEEDEEAPAPSEPETPAAPAVPPPPCAEAPAPQKLSEDDPVLEYRGTEDAEPPQLAAPVPAPLPGARSKWPRLIFALYLVAVAIAAAVLGLRE
jgi:hypothetical protein